MRGKSCGDLLCQSRHLEDFYHHGLYVCVVVVMLGSDFAAIDT